MVTTQAPLRGTAVAPLEAYIKANFCDTGVSWCGHMTRFEHSGRTLTIDTNIYPDADIRRGGIGWSAAQSMCTAVRFWSERAAYGITTIRVRASDGRTILDWTGQRACGE